MYLVHDHIWSPVRGTPVPPCFSNISLLPSPASLISCIFYLSPSPLFYYSPYFLHSPHSSILGCMDLHSVDLVLSCSVASCSLWQRGSAACLVRLLSLLRCWQSRDPYLCSLRISPLPRLVSVIVHTFYILRISPLPSLSCRPSRSLGCRRLTRSDRRLRLPLQKNKGH